VLCACLGRVFQEEQGEELLKEVAWIVTFLTTREDRYVAALLERGVVPALVAMLAAVAQVRKGVGRGGDFWVARAEGGVVSSAVMIVRVTRSVCCPCLMRLMWWVFSYHRVVRGRGWVRLCCDHWRTSYRALPGHRRWWRSPTSCPRSQSYSHIHRPWTPGRLQRR
jgi:hypothetical protein